MITSPSVMMVSLVSLVVALVAVGAAKARRLTGSAPGAARRFGTYVAGGLAVWLALTAALAQFGTLSVWSALPPRLPLLPLCAFAVFLTLGRTAVVKTLIANSPRSWPIAAQTFRVGVELVLFAFHAAGQAPLQVTFEGRNFDILVGATAPVLAWLVHRQRVTPAAVAVWNVLGLAMLANTIVTVATSIPGPLHRDWPGEPFTALAAWPLVWLPAFLAPLAVFFHIVSLRQTLPLLGRNRAPRGAV
jgi:hypothetical protein